MKFKRKKLVSALSCAALGLIVMPAFAADEPLLGAVNVNGNPTAATFSGGATLDGSQTFTNSVPSTEAFDLVGTINVDPADVGKLGNMYAVLYVGEFGFFQMISGGFFLPWNGDVNNLVPFARKSLPAQQKITIFNDMVAQYSNLQNMDFATWLAYTPIGVHDIVLSTNSIYFHTEDTPVSGGDAPCPAATTTASAQFENKTVCILSGTISADMRLTANNIYLLNGAVFVGGDNTNNATLTIDAGTKVIAPVGLNFLVVSRGSKLVANGTSAQPIVFTYDDEANATASTTGRWGGIIINGNAPVNGCAPGTVLCELEGEGSTGKYGGNNPTDNSGVLNYVIVKYPGQNITETNELNGIAFQGVGSGTVVNYVQVHGSSDDGVEFFGGTVNAKHLVLTSNEDDSFDWTFGWNGKVQHAIIKQRPGNGDRGIEADNNEFSFDTLPRSKPTLANFTFIGKGAGGRGIELRRGTGANIHNTVVTGFDTYCLDINDNATFINGGASATTLTGQLTMTHTRFACTNSFAESGSDPWSISTWFNNQSGNSTGTADLTGFINGPVLNGNAAATLSDIFFDQVDYIGAVKNPQSDWASSWIIER